MKQLLKLFTFLLVLSSVTFTGQFYSGKATCASSGNKQVSTTSVNLYTLTVTANIANGGIVYVGASNVDTTMGTPLVPTGSYTVTRGSAAVNVNGLYFACTVNTDGVSWVGSQ